MYCSHAVQWGATSVKAESVTHKMHFSAATFWKQCAALCAVNGTTHKKTGVACVLSPGGGQVWLGHSLGKELWNKIINISDQKQTFNSMTGF